MSSLTRLMEQLFEIIGLSAYNTHKKFENNFDAFRFDDPIALETQWAPMPSSVGSNLQMYLLKQKGAHELAIVPNILKKWFYILFIAAGIGLMTSPLSFHLHPTYSTGDIDTLGHLILFVFGIIFCVVGFSLYSFAHAPITFHRANGFSSKAARKGLLFSQAKPDDLSAPLRDIYALQIIPVYFSRTGRKSRPFYNFQLNIVLSDSQRLHVVNYSSLIILREDAFKISSFLGIPLWDATQ